MATIAINGLVLAIIIYAGINGLDSSNTIAINGLESSNITISIIKRTRLLRVHMGSLHMGSLRFFVNKTYR